MFKKYLLSGIVVVSLAACGNAGNDAAETTASAPKAATAAAGRDQIKIVGSSTVYPFATTVAENFGRSTSFIVARLKTCRVVGVLTLKTRPA